MAPASTAKHSTQVSAVATTGIYCRPQCSARPNPENVSPFPSPVAAEAAGYRSCLRCRPDRHLRSTTPDAVPDAVATALGLISDGFLDRFDEEALADRVGYSTRQLRRLFEQHVGATPGFVGRSRRAHFARRLLDESDLSMPAIARAAGFGSVRQMSRIVESIFAFSPSDLRRKRRAGDVLVADGGLRLRLPFVEPLDRTAALAHLGPRVTAGVESVEDGIYRRTLEVCGNPGAIEVDLREHNAAPYLELTAHLPTFDSIIDDVARIRSMFGLDDDVQAAEDHLLADPLLAPIVRTQGGLRVVGGWDRFETAVRVIVGQQVSVIGASTITGRIAARYGRALPSPVLGLDRLFPRPDELLKVDPEGLGMPGARSATVSALAAAVVDGSVDLYAPSADVRAQLLAVRGIGPWTADVITMRATRDPDVIPCGDLGIRHAIGRLLERDDPPTEEECRDLAAVWSPHQSFAAQHLWASLNNVKPEEKS